MYRTGESPLRKVTFSFLRGGERAAVRQFVLREEYVSRKMLRAAGEGEELPPFELFLDRERIDNDVNISREWDRYELSRARERILSEKREGGTRTTERVFAADSVRPIARATVKEEALGGGAFRVSAHITVEKDLWSVPRIGFRFALPRDFHTVSWYGRGPGEAYCDRHAASPVGFYRGDVRTMNYRYPKPQESGSRCGTRFVALSDGVRGLLFDAAEDFSFQATEYDAHQTPAHDCERRRSGKVFLHLDKKMAGVGSNACGPGLKEEYCVREKELDLTFCVKPFREGEDLFALHRTVFGR